MFSFAESTELTSLSGVRRLHNANLYVTRRADEEELYRQIQRNGRLGDL
jgi:hypothetical protein